MYCLVVVDLAIAIAAMVGANEVSGAPQPVTTAHINPAAASRFTIDSKAIRWSFRIL